MSLTSCVTCGHPCSNSAKACPKCGQPDPTNLPLTVDEGIEKYRSLSLLVISLFVFVTWIFASTEKFYVVALVGLGIFVVICLLGFFSSLAINWKRTVGAILLFIPAVWGIESYKDHEYLKVFIVAILSLPGLYIYLVNLESK